MKLNQEFQYDETEEAVSEKGVWYLRNIFSYEKLRPKWLSEALLKLESSFGGVMKQDQEIQYHDTKEVVPGNNDKFPKCQFLFQLWLIKTPYVSTPVGIAHLAAENVRFLKIVGSGTATRWIMQLKILHLCELVVKYDW